jgi:thiopurine S-methyltransferase
MDLDFWHQKWKTNNIFFHQNQVHPHLVKYFKTPKGKVMVPLCGKSLDMIWLLEQGHEVVGIEISPIACEAFFQENKIPFEKNGTVYHGPNISIWCEDFFNAPDKAWQGCTAVYDRAALIALPMEMRKKYVTHITKQLQQNSSSFNQMLLICMEYPQSMMEGPPFSVLESEVTELYGKSFHIQKLHSDTISLEKLPNIEVFQKAYSLTFPS